MLLNKVGKEKNELSGFNFSWMLWKGLWARSSPQRIAENTHNLILLMGWITKLNSQPYRVSVVEERPLIGNKWNPESWNGEVGKDHDEAGDTESLNSDQSFYPVDEASPCPQLGCPQNGTDKITSCLLFYWVTNGQLKITKHVREVQKYRHQKEKMGKTNPRKRMYHETRQFYFFKKIAKRRAKVKARFLKSKKRRTKMFWKSKEGFGETAKEFSQTIDKKD